MWESEHRSQIILGQLYLLDIEITQSRYVSYRPGDEDMTWAVALILRQIYALKKGIEGMYKHIRMIYVCAGKYRAEWKSPWAYRSVLVA